MLLRSEMLLITIVLGVYCTKNNLLLTEKLNSAKIIKVSCPFYLSVVLVRQTHNTKVEGSNPVCTKNILKPNFTDLILSSPTVPICNTS